MCVSNSSSQRPIPNSPSLCERGARMLPLQTFCVVLNGFYSLVGMNQAFLVRRAIQSKQLSRFDSDSPWHMLQTPLSSRFGKEMLGKMRAECALLPGTLLVQFEVEGVVSSRKIGGLFEAMYYENGCCSFLPEQTDQIVCLMRVGQHWVVASLRPRERVVHVYDSLAVHDDARMTVSRSEFLSAFRAALDSPFPMRLPPFDEVVTVDCPQQHPDGGACFYYAFINTLCLCTHGGKGELASSGHVQNLQLAIASLFLHASGHITLKGEEHAQLQRLLPSFTASEAKERMSSVKISGPSGPPLAHHVQTARACDACRASKI